MISTIKRHYEDQVFYPRWWSIFVNSMYFARKGVAAGVSRYASNLHGTLLDFGCGAKPYARLFTVKCHIGVDIAETGHVHRDSKVDVYYNGRTLPFEDQHFDSIFSSEVLEHIFNLDEILAELNRVLKPGGKMLITVPWCWDQHEEPYDFGRYTEWGLKHILDKHGFEMIAHEKSSTYVETISQLIGLYFYKNLFWERRLLSKLVQLFIVSPVFIAGALLSKVLPDNGNLYLTHIALAQKRP